MKNAIAKEAAWGCIFCLIFSGGLYAQVWSIKNNPPKIPATLQMASAAATSLQDNPPDLPITFQKEPAMESLSPTINFQIGEQFINQTFMALVSQPVVLSSGSNQIQMMFNSFAIDFEPNSCTINFQITITFVVGGITQSVVIPYGGAVQANEFHYEVSTEMIYAALNQYNEWINYLHASFSFFRVL